MTLNRQIIINLLIYFSLFAFFVFIASMYYQHVGGFSFGDEWNNFIAAYFMLKGKALYSQIFYNHQMLIVYLSYFIQKMLNPKSLYQLVLYHRMFILTFSFLFDLLIIYRFKKIGIAFTFFYELTKFYLFGNLFLSESLIVQPLVYLLGITWYKFQKIKISSFDLIICGIFAWFVLFMRETFIPVTILLYVLILLDKKINRIRLMSFVIFSLLSLLTLFSIYRSISQYIFQVGYFNITVMIPYEARSSSVFFVNGVVYPILILFGGKWNYFRNLLIGLDVVFLFSIVRYVLYYKRLKEMIIIIVILGLANLRFIPPGNVFFEAFHILPWYGLFIVTILFLISKFFQTIYFRKTAYLLISLLVMIYAYAFLSPQGFIWDKVNKNEEFTVNYANYYITGEVFRRLSNPGDLLFADLWDYFIHWQANLDSPYKYSLYSFAASGDRKFVSERENMLKKTPPSFYYTYCPKGVYESIYLTENEKKSYVQLYTKGKPSCLYINVNKLPYISKTQWNEAKKLGYYLP